MFGRVWQRLFDHLWPLCTNTTRNLQLRQFLFIILRYYSMSFNKMHVECILVCYYSGCIVYVYIIYLDLDAYVCRYRLVDAMTYLHTSPSFLGSLELPPLFLQNAVKCSNINPSALSDAKAVDRAPCHQAINALVNRSLGKQLAGVLKVFEAAGSSHHHEWLESAKNDKDNVMTLLILPDTPSDLAS